MAGYVESPELGSRGPRLISLFHYLSSAGCLDGVGFCKIRLRSHSAHSIDSWNPDIVVTGGILSVLCLIALHGEVNDWRRKLRAPPVSVVYFIHICDPQKGTGKLTCSMFDLFQ